MMIDDLAEQKRAAAADFERAPLAVLRWCMENDPVTFSTLALAAIGPMEAWRLGPNPTDAELGWKARELLVALSGDAEEPAPFH